MIRTALVLSLLAASCSSPGPAPPEATDANLPREVLDARAVGHGPGGERVADFAALVPDDVPGAGSGGEAGEVQIERVSAGVPWPRGLAFVDGELVVLARGRHRRAGGLDHAIEDWTGTLFAVDPDVAEPVVPGALASPAVAANARVLAAAEGPPFRLPDATLEPTQDVLMDRPYCTLIWDARSRNLFVCGYSGVDLPGPRFRKNATDSILRYDLRTGRWHPVELHDPSAVPTSALGYVVPNEHYPHNDPGRDPAPHGWLNGPDGGCVAGDYLYCVAKDNHLVVQYDLAEVRADPDAGFPASRPVLGPRVTVRSPAWTRELEVLGPSAAVARDGWLYLGYRTSSVVLRFALEPDGSLAQPPVGELIAVFEPWDADARRSANLIDLAFDSRGELYVSCATAGRIWNVGVPDPERPFLGDDRSARPTSAPPFADLGELLGKRTACGNIAFDERDRLYVCAGNYDTDSTRLAGVVYRLSRAGS